MIILLFIITALIWVLLKSTGKKVPGPIGLPILGSYLSISDPEKALTASTEWAKIYGNIFQISVGIEKMLFSSNIKFNEKILTSQKLIKKSREYEMMKRWWGNGLLTSSGQKWKSMRKILTPAFHYGILEDFVDIFDKRGRLLLENLDKKVNKESFNIHNTFALYTLDVICESSMGVCIDAQTNPNHEYLLAVDEFCSIVYNRFVHPLYRYDFFYKKSKHYKRELEVIKVLKDFSLKIIRDRRESLNLINKNEDELDEYGKKKKASFLDVLLKSTVNGEALTDDEIREQVDTFLFEGHDTTSIALAYIAFNLANNPDVQNKILKEVRSILEDNTNKAATIAELNNMKYLEMVIKESLRLYPSVPFIGRTLLENFDYDGYTIKKSTTLVTNIWNIHRNEKTFPDPNKFDPERFSSENRSKYGPYEYIPFSAGPRNCIGQKFAMFELKAVISKMLLRFEIVKAIPEHVPKNTATLTLTSKNGIHVGLRKR